MALINRVAGINRAWVERNGGIDFKIYRGDGMRFNSLFCRGINCETIYHDGLRLYSKEEIENSGHIVMNLNVVYPVFSIFDGKITAQLMGWNPREYKTYPVVDAGSEHYCIVNNELIIDILQDERFVQTVSKHDLIRRNSAFTVFNGQETELEPCVVLNCDSYYWALMPKR